MPLAAGEKLGPYEIVEPIGAGGMGEVYRAHDPRMGRDVAIKIAAERFSERFDREVRAVAALNLSLDEKRLAYSENTGGKISTVAVEEQGGQLKAGKPEPFFTSQFNDGAPAFSPDGRWLAYGSNESGKNELYVRTFPSPASGQGGKWQISNSGFGGFFAWPRDGRELLYQAGDQIMAVSYTAKGETFVAEKPQVWLAKVGGAAYDLSPDGKRLVVQAAVDATEAPKADHEVVFLENFFDELRRRVPAGK